MTTLVTGATGHIGANLVRALLARGEPLRALVRDRQRAPALDGLDVSRVEGHLGDPGALADAVRGCARVYHLGGLVSLRSDDRSALEEINVRGTRRLLQACHEAGVRRVVHASSFGTVAQPYDGGPSTEEHVLGPFEDVSDYDRSKAASEVEALRAAVRGLDVVMINPSGVVGPHDFKPSLLGQTILDFGRGRLPAYVAGAHDFVSVQDVVSGAIRAMAHGRRGERYLLTGELVELDTVMGWLARFTGRRPPRVRLPPRALWHVAALKDRLEPRLRFLADPRFNRHTMQLLAERRRGDATKARRELGFEPRPVEQAFRDAVDWFRHRGELQA